MKASPGSASIGPAPNLSARRPMATLLMPITPLPDPQYSASTLPRT